MAIFNSYVSHYQRVLVQSHEANNMNCLVNLQVQADDHQRGIFCCHLWLSECIIHSIFTIHESSISCPIVIHCFFQIVIHVFIIMIQYLSEISIKMIHIKFNNFQFYYPIFNISYYIYQLSLSLSNYQTIIIQLSIISYPLGELDPFIHWKIINITIINSYPIFNKYHFPTIQLSLSNYHSHYPIIH